MQVDYEKFLRWAYPNPLGNLVRGHLAEYLVGVALGCAGEHRIEWEAFDLEFEGIRIEVKAAGLRQAWISERPSPPQFGVGTPASDVHVFCLHHEADEGADPTFSEAWTFFVLPTTELQGRRSVRLTVLRGLTREVEWEQLPAAVKEAAQPRPGQPR